MKRTRKLLIASLLGVALILGSGADDAFARPGGPIQPTAAAAGTDPTGAKGGTDPTGAPPGIDPTAR